MAKLFLSHSSKDKEFCIQLREDLIRMGHTPWLDMYDVKVGDDIVEGIGAGVTEADYVVLVLTPESVSSRWVKKEWHAKFWTEIDEGKIRLLPVLLKDCTIPSMLQTKKYADFRQSYAVGFADLVAAIPILHTPQSGVKGLKHDEQLIRHIEMCQGHQLPLAQCLSGVLAYASQKADQRLLEFCRLELSGYRHLKDLAQEDIDRLQIQHRMIELFVSPFAQVNLQAMQWGQNASTIIDHLRHNNNFYLWKLIMPEPIGELESLASRLGPDTIMTITRPMAEFMPESEHPNVVVYGYADPHTVTAILNGTRTRVTSMLMAHLPGKLDPSKSVEPT
ncbi:MAG TPA: toll/interleukin-1 receptor domain-containing protein [Phycisphaerales bacterium]|nr:toll/interleukin-1 receptor domain-containing protein [Phycisphaerales bacterium]